MTSLSKSSIIICKIINDLANEMKFKQYKNKQMIEEKIANYSKYYTIIPKIHLVLAEKLSFIHIRRRKFNCSDESQELLSYKFYNPFDPKECTLRAYVIYALMLYVTFKLILISLLNVYVRYLLDQQWEPQLIAEQVYIDGSNGMNRTKIECARNEDLLDTTPELTRHIHYVIQLLQILGSWTTPANDVALFALPTLIVALTLPIILSLYFRNYIHPLSSLEYVLDPQREFERVEMEIRSTIVQLADTRMSIEKFSGRNSNRNLNDEIMIDNKRFCACEMISREARLKFTQLILKSDLARYIWPAHMNYIPYLSMNLFWLTWPYQPTNEHGSRLFTFTFKNVWQKESMVRQERYELNLECQKLISNSSLIRDPMRFVEFDTISTINEDHLSSGEFDLSKYNGIQYCNLHQLPTALSSPATIQTTCEIIIYSILTYNIWYGFSFTSAIEAIVNQFIWFYQLKKQMLICIDMLQYYNCLFTYDRLLVQKNREILIKIQESLIMTLINLKIFLKYYNHNKNYTENFCNGLILWVCWISILSNGFTDRASPQLTEWLIWEILIALNANTFCLVVYLSLLNRLRYIFHLIGKIVAYCAIVKQHESLTAIRLRELMLIDEFVQHQYSARILGVPITHDVVLGLHSSIYGALLFIVLSYANVSKNY